MRNIMKPILRTDWQGTEEKILIDNPQRLSDSEERKPSNPYNRRRNQLAIHMDSKHTKPTNYTPPKKKRKK
jgi:hypothetical protein